MTGVRNAVFASAHRFGLQIWVFCGLPTEALLLLRSGEGYHRCAADRDRGERRKYDENVSRETFSAKLRFRGVRR
jgi:hypothetical protein